MFLVAFRLGQPVYQLNIESDSEREKVGKARCRNQYRMFRDTRVIGGRSIRTDFGLSTFWTSVTQMTLLDLNFTCSNESSLIRGSLAMLVLGCARLPFASKCENVFHIRPDDSGGKVGPTKSRCFLLLPCIRVPLAFAHRRPRIVVCLAILMALFGLVMSGARVDSRLHW